MEDEVTIGHLQRHPAVELSISGLIDLAHPAFADEGGDVVVAESGADVEGHVLLRRTVWDGEQPNYTGSSPKESASPEPAAAREREQKKLREAPCLGPKGSDGRTPPTQNHPQSRDVE